MSFDDLGHELRRPEADYLRHGIYELRGNHQGIQDRMPYFFHGRTAMADLAVDRKARFQADPEAHTFRPGGRYVR